ncbi:hypothetical protein GE278_04220 [Enterobacteriaceae bacterium Kacie_13]|nr:hypothetical protein GE278_04220 [Enterobacteriaceae bacterium Kacie_13]
MKTNNAIIGLVLIHLLFLMHLSIISSGGTGLLLPGNILAWIMMALIIMLFWSKKTRDIKNIIITPMARYLMVAIVCMFIPVLFTPHEYLLSGVTSLAGLLCGFLLYFTLLQCRFSLSHITLVLYGILASALVIVLPAVMRLLTEEHTLLQEVVRSVFAQRNLAGSFIATALGIALFLWLNDAGHSPLPQGICRTLQVATLFLLPLYLTLGESRIGVLSAAMSTLALTLLFWRKSPVKACLGLMLIALGLLCGWLMIQVMLQDVDFEHAGSNFHRLLMLRETIAMIIQHPLQGWGLGSFEHQYQHFLVDQDPPVPNGEVANHPHNEILFGWVEGGICYVFAYALMIFAAIRLWKKARARDQLHGQCSLRGLFLLMLPLVLHTQVEFPFYGSVTHWFVFLLLLAITDSQVYQENEQVTLAVPEKTTRGAQMIMVCGALIAIPFLITTLQSGIQLSKIESRNLRGGAGEITLNPAKELWNPWVFAERVEFDRQVNSLLSFNQTRDPRVLINYLKWSSLYLQTHIDKNVYATRIAILNFTGKREEAKRLKTEAHYIFFGDPQFLLTSNTHASQK